MEKSAGQKRRKLKSEMSEIYIYIYWSSRPGECKEEEYGIFFTTACILN